ncbi:MAG TPA: FlgD immunoglobulin-like domain containing protein [bacterium]|jgi:hypothetical protein
MHGKSYLLIILVSLLALTICGARAQDNFNIQPVVQYHSNWHDAVSDVALTNGYEFVLCGGDGLRILREYDTDAPVVAATMSSEDIYQARRIVASGNYLYLAGNDMYGVYVIDVSDPAQPHEVASLPIYGSKYSFRIVDHYLLVCTSLSGLHIVDISQPTEPQIIWQQEADAWALDADMVGDRLYVVSNGVLVYDISNLSAPQWLDSMNFYLGDGHIVGIRVKDDHAYLACGEAGFRVLDLTERQLVAHIDSLSYAFNLELRGNLVYLHYGPIDCPLAAIDVSDPVAPQVLSIYSPPTDIVGFVLDGDNAYVADGWYGLRTADISDPANLHETRSFNPIGNFKDVIYSAGLAYARSEVRVQVFDVANFQQPVERGYVELPSEWCNFLVSGNAGFTLSPETESMRVYDFSDPVHPICVDTVACAGARAAVYEHYLYALEGGGLRIYDIADPRAVQEVGFYGHVMCNALITTGDHYAFVETGYSAQYSMLVLDLTDPAAPVLANTYSMSQASRALTTSPGYLFELEDAMLKIFAISQMDTWQPVSAVSLPSGMGDNFRAISVAGNHVLLTTNGSGLLAYDIADPATPLLTGYYGTPGSANGVAANGNFVLVAGMSNLGIYDCSGAFLSGGSGTAAVLPHDVALLPNYPNPFNMTTQVPFDLPAQSRVTLRVYDVLGRTVATLADGNYAAGSHVIAWQGITAAGLPAASGQYFVRLETANKVQTRPITLLK